LSPVSGGPLPADTPTKFSPAFAAALFLVLVSAPARARGLALVVVLGVAAILELGLAAVLAVGLAAILELGLAAVLELGLAAVSARTLALVLALELTPDFAPSFAPTSVERLGAANTSCGGGRPG